MLIQLIITLISMLIFAVVFVIFYKAKMKGKSVALIFENTLIVTWALIFGMIFLPSKSQYLTAPLPFLVVMLYLTSRDYVNPAKKVISKTE